MEMETQTENINELIQALSKAQGSIQSAKKDKTNPFFKSKYADLCSVWDACRQALSDNSLAVVQTTQPIEDGTLMLVTTLGHSSGQWMRSFMPIITEKNKTDPQALGKAITYMKRYSLSAMVGVAPDDDDDGESTMGDRKGSYKKANIKDRPEENNTKPQAPEPDFDKEISKIQFDELNSLINGHDEIREALTTWVQNPPYEKKSLKGLPQRVFQWVMKSCRSAIANKYKKQTEQVEEVKDVSIAAK